jgi:ligand-binding SRPBCC domain-containing protein
MEQYQFQLQDKPNTNVGMSHPTQLFWAFFTRFDCVNIITPLVKVFLGLTKAV